MEHQQKELYEQNWAKRSIRNPEMWPINNVINEILKKNGKILEIGPGPWPKSPFSNTIFLELTEVCAKKLKKVGAITSTGSIENLPFIDGIFDIVVALEVIEHVPNIQKSFSDVKRVLKKGGFFIFSTPVHQSLWTYFDSLAGHLRRFDPTELIKITYLNDFKLMKFSGRKDAPLIVSNLNALLEIRFRKLFFNLSEIGIDILSNVQRSRLYRKINRQAFNYNLWFEPNLFIAKSKNLGNLTLIFQKREK